MDNSSNTLTLPEDRNTIADAWAIAAGRLADAKAALDEFERQTWRPAFLDEFYRLDDDVTKAEEALLALPAPDLVAFLWKFERHRANIAGIWPHLDKGWDAVGADLARLASLQGGQK